MIKDKEINMIFMKLERLAMGKFKPLPNAQAAIIRGGEKTSAGRMQLGAEYRRVDGQAQQRIQWRSYGADEIGGGNEFYYNTDVFWSAWENY